MTFGGGDGMWQQIGALQQEEADGLVDAGARRRHQLHRHRQRLFRGPSRSRSPARRCATSASPRDEVVVATKVLRPDGRRARTAAAPRAATSSTQAKASLKRLQLDHIDLYQIHGFDAVDADRGDARGARPLVRHGLVRYVGVSNWAAWQVAKALGIAERARPRAASRSLQAYYTLAGRDLEREIVPMLKSEGVGLMVWSPLAGGLLCGKYDRRDEGAAATAAAPASTSRRSTATAPTTSSTPCARSPKRRRTVAQIALAWLLHQPAVTSVIVGAKRREQLADNLAAADIELTAEDLAALDAASALPPNIRAGCSSGRAQPRRGAAAAVTGAAGRLVWTRAIAEAPARGSAGDRALRLGAQRSLDGLSDPALRRHAGRLGPRSHRVDDGRLQRYFHQDAFLDRSPGRRAS